MASISNRLLHIRRDMYSYTHRPHPYPLRHFSSPSDSSDTPQPDSGQSRPASFSDYFKEVKATLQKEPPRPQQPPNKPFSLSKRTPSQSPPHKAASLEEIRRNLSEFRSRSAPPPPKPLRSAETSPSAPYVSLQELYSKSVSAKGGGSDASSDAKPFPGAGAPHSLSAIRETLNRLKSSAPAATRRTDPAGKISDRVLPPFKLLDGIGGDIPSPFYGKERTGGWGAAYGYKDIGEKLKSLRPEKRTGQWFSFQELNDRLAQLREIENQESEKGIGVAIKDIREGLKKINKAKEEKPRLGISILESVGTPSFMLSPPKEHLVEKFFHPDNMSSAEKLKLELKKVREEFKMSESDCGSARVQVAQLTTKIKHLSSVLAKKDKHSRRGLLAMVQRRKKLLKYLRRTDWDSYELVLSKFGLRDNPDLKA